MPRPTRVNVEYTGDDADKVVNGGGNGGWVALFVFVLLLIAWGVGK